MPPSGNGKQDDGKNDDTNKQTNHLCLLVCANFVPYTFDSYAMQDDSFLYTIPWYGVLLSLLCAMALFYFSGNQLRHYFISKKWLKEDDTIGTVEGSLLGLFAFFLGFTFSMAGSRYDERRQSIVHEANCIGTAILRTELYPDSVQFVLKKQFSKYLQDRLNYFDAARNMKALDKSLNGTNSNGLSLWNSISNYSKQGLYAEANRQMIPALNDMLDAVTSRDASKNAKVPSVIIYVLILLSLCSCFIVGYGTRGRLINNAIGYLFIFMVTVAIYLIIDLDTSRTGLIDAGSTNEKMVELKSLLN